MVVVVDGVWGVRCCALCDSDIYYAWRVRRSFWRDSDIFYVRGVRCYVPCDSDIFCVIGFGWPAWTVRLVRQRQKHLERESGMACHP